jgi:hypothetical protein
MDPLIYAGAFDIFEAFRFPGRTLRPRRPAGDPIPNRLS